MEGFEKVSNSFPVILMLLLISPATPISCQLTVLLCCQVLELEEEKGDWGFKALKQMIKINFKLVRTNILPN